MIPEVVETINCVPLQSAVDAINCVRQFYTFQSHFEDRTNLADGRIRGAGRNFDTSPDLFGEISLNVIIRKFDPTRNRTRPFVKGRNFDGACSNNLTLFRDF